MDTDFHDLKHEELTEKVYNALGQIATYIFAHIYRSLLGSVIPGLTRNPGCFLDSRFRRDF
jgi:hypothetical protein